MNQKQNTSKLQTWIKTDVIEPGPQGAVVRMSAAPEASTGSLRRDYKGTAGESTPNGGVQLRGAASFEVDDTSRHFFEKDGIYQVTIERLNT